MLTGSGEGNKGNPAGSVIGAVAIVGTILVTGATGFIGQRFVQALLDRRESVRCLVRAARPGLLRGAELVLGDVLRPQSLAKALTDVDVVYHLAGATSVRHPAEYRRVNTVGTQHLAAACAAMARPPVVVYLSSLAAAGPALADRPRRESDLPAPVSRYGQSKLAGEQALRVVADRVPTTVVRAVAVFGPGDVHTVRLFRAAKMGVNGVPGSGDVRLSWVYVEDVVRSLLLAAERGARITRDDPAAGTYFVALDDRPTLREIGELAGRLVGAPGVRTVALPPPFCRFWGHVIDLWVSLTGKPRLLTSDKMRDALAGSWTCETDKARRELGFTAEVGLEEGFTRAVAWYRAQGLL